MSFTIVSSCQTSIVCNLCRTTGPRFHVVMWPTTNLPSSTGIMWVSTPQNIINVTQVDKLGLVLSSLPITKWTFFPYNNWMYATFNKQGSLSFSLSSVLLCVFSLFFSRYIFRVTGSHWYYYRYCKNIGSVTPIKFLLVYILCIS